ncbi:hypothetical protein MB84_06500 [Pandoraea oxalativorans]|uniref:Uncharacterized protein n=1 Tax=Pandoraea oxalativorans TaxID=573737 RepID=A0A0E3YAA6_9BURK|nr:hypothetical protein MB84_06500 [Pandoraea oxalativorans]
MANAAGHALQGGVAARCAVLRDVGARSARAQWSAQAAWAWRNAFASGLRGAPRVRDDGSEARSP